MVLGETFVDLETCSTNWLNEFFLKKSLDKAEMAVSGVMNSAKPVRPRSVRFAWCKAGQCCETSFFFPSEVSTPRRSEFFFFSTF